MLAELFLYATTPCPPFVFGMGYLSEAIAIRSRYRRCAAAWAGHLEESKNSVRRTMQECRTRRKAMVFGSGMLLDFPLQEMAEAFDELFLVDLVHLRSVRRAVRRWKNIRLVTADIIGVSERLFQNGKQGISQLPTPTPLLPETDNRTDLVVSLNLLSQLPVMPAQYAESKMHIDPAKLSAWKDQIIQSHYQALTGLTCPVCLISDYEIERRARDGTVLDRSSTIGDMHLLRTDSKWLWEIAPLGECSRKFSFWRRVAAIHLNTRRSI